MTDPEKALIVLLMAIQQAGDMAEPGECFESLPELLNGYRHTETDIGAYDYALRIAQEIKRG